MTLPGDVEMWPQQVVANGSPVVVIEWEGKPSVKLHPGTWRFWRPEFWDAFSGRP